VPPIDAPSADKVLGGDGFVCQIPLPTPKTPLSSGAIG
jgi:hypothetical protein